MNNYISQFVSESTVFSIYHTKLFILGSSELSKIISEDYLQDFRRKIRHPTMIESDNFEPTISLPDYVDPTKLIENIRISCGKALLFINVWMQENNCVLLDDSFETNKDYFSKTLVHILSSETNHEVVELAFDLKKSLEEIYPYLGHYRGNFCDNICSVGDAVTATVFLAFVSSV